jgi:hypothetical protein
MEERELTQLLQQAGDRVTPGPPPLQRIVDAGEALRGRRSGRLRTFAVAATAAAVLGGGAVAATVIDLPSGGDDSAAGEAADAASAGDGAGGGEAAPDIDADRSDQGGAAADAAAMLPVTPDVAGPGDVVQLDVPSEVPFRVQWLLERSGGRGWTSTYVLVDADFAAEAGVPLSRRVEDSERITAAPEVHDAPVALVVPDAAPPGSYRICQAVEDGTEWCGSLTVTG